MPPPSAMAGRPRSAGCGARERASGGGSPSRIHHDLRRSLSSGLRAGSRAKRLVLGKKTKLGYWVCRSHVPQSHFLSSGQRAQDRLQPDGPQLRAFREPRRAPEAQADEPPPGRRLLVWRWSLGTLPGFQKDRAVVRPGSRATQGCRCRGFWINQAPEGKKARPSACPIVNVPKGDPPVQNNTWEEGVRTQGASPRYVGTNSRPQTVRNFPQRFLLPRHWSRDTFSLSFSGARGLGVYRLVRDKLVGVLFLFLLQCF